MEPEVILMDELLRHSIAATKKIEDLMEGEKKLHHCDSDTLNAAGETYLRQHSIFLNG